MALILINYVTENRTAFESKVRSISSKLGIDPNHLMIVMWKESKLNHRAYNGASGASGLIQFLPSTATSLGASTTALRSMSNVSQLDYVYAYLKKYKTRTLTDLYLSVFYPAAIGKSSSYVIASSPSVTYRQNAAVDLSNDGMLTVGDVSRWLLSSLPLEAQKYVSTRGQSGAPWLLVILLVGLGGYYAYTKGYLNQLIKSLKIHKLK